jgi:hypothetical protein
MANDQTDEIVYQKNLIIISKTLARFGGATYPKVVKFSGAKAD